MVSNSHNELSHGSSKAQPRVHPLMLLSVFYALGLFGFSKVLRSPALYGMPWDQGMALTLFSCGGIIGAAFLFLANWKTPIGSKPLRIRAFAMSATALTVLAGVLFSLSAALPPYSLTMNMCALLLVGCSVPPAVFAWVIIYRSLDYRDILLNSGCAYILVSFLSIALTTAFIEYFYLICAAFLIAGSAAPLLSGSLLATDLSVVVAGNAGEGNSEEDVIPRRFFVSVPFAGLILYALTTGLVLNGNAETSDPFVIGIGTCLVILFAFALVSVKFSRLQDRQLMFYLYGFGLPAIAIIAFLVKMIPIDFVSSTIFRELMKIYFQLILLAAWTYLVGYARIDSSKLLIVCGVSQIAVSLSLITGNFLNGVGSPISTAILGLITAVFLLFAIVTVGRNFISFVKGPETAEDLVKPPLDMEAVCEIVSSEYKLSPRETEVLKELAYGHSSSYVAKVLFISNNTARTHMKSIYKKLDISSREDLLELLRNKQNAV